MCRRRTRNLAQVRPSMAAEIGGIGVVDSFSQEVPGIVSLEFAMGLSSSASPGPGLSECERRSRQKERQRER